MKIFGHQQEIRDILERAGEIITSVVQPTDKQIQFRTQRGAVVSWYPTTGSVVIGGKKEPKEQLEAKLKGIEGVV